MKRCVQVYTDGACSGNPGPGGWGAVLIFQGKEKEISGFESDTTNNRMELMAAIESLSALKEACIVDLFTDSAYLCNAFNQNWIGNWQKNGWKTSNKQPVENQDLWKKLLDLLETHTVQFKKVKGHSDNPYNNRCDQLARNQITANRSQ